MKETTRKGRRRGADDFGLREKYYHSKGAALLREGDIGGAVRYFRKALTLEETPYVHFELARAFLQMGRPTRALAEIDRAIVLAPRAAGYYELRSTVRKALGDDEGRAADLRRARQIDPDRARMTSIERALAVLERLFSYDPGGLADAEPSDSRLSAAVLGFVAEALGMRDAVEASSCDLPCPAYCCYFGGETIRHGLSTGAWKLLAIRSLLKEKGFEERRFLRRMVFRGRGHEARLIAPTGVVREGRGHYVYFPARGRKRLGRDLMRALPRGRDCGELLWINEASRPCAFLASGRCMIHDAGGESSLPACKEFLCFTGLVFAALRRLAIVGGADLRGRTMADLNRIAVDALLIMAEGMDGDRLLTKLRASAGSALRKAVEADGEGRAGDVSRLLSRYGEIRARYTETLTARSLVVKEKVGALFASGRPRGNDRP